MSFWTCFNLFPDPPPIPERKPTEHKPIEWKVTEHYAPELKTITITPEKIELVEKKEPAVDNPDVKPSAPTTGLFNPKYKPNPELTKLLKDAKPATEEELRTQRRGYAGLCWKAPSEWKSSNEFLERGDAMIQAIVAINPKVLDDEDHWLLLQVETLSRYIRVRPEQHAGLSDPSPSNCKTITPYHKALMSATKRRMYVAAHALRRRITPLADEAVTSDD